MGNMLVVDAVQKTESKDCRPSCETKVIVVMEIVTLNVLKRLGPVKRAQKLCRGKTVSLDQTTWTRLACTKTVAWENRFAGSKYD